MLAGKAFGASVGFYRQIDGNKGYIAGRRHIQRLIDGTAIKTELSDTEAWRIADRMADECLTPTESRFDCGNHSRLISCFMRDNNNLLIGVWGYPCVSSHWVIDCCYKE